MAVIWGNHRLISANPQNHSITNLSYKVSPVDTWRKHNVIVTSKRRRIEVIMTLPLHREPVGFPPRGVIELRAILHHTVLGNLLNKCIAFHACARWYFEVKIFYWSTRELIKCVACTCGLINWCVWLMNNNGWYKGLVCPWISFSWQKGHSEYLSAAYAYGLVNKLTWPDSPVDLCPVLGNSQVKYVYNSNWKTVE